MVGKVHFTKFSNQNRNFKNIGLNKDSFNNVSTKPGLFEIKFRKHSTFSLLFGAFKDRPKYEYETT